MPIENRKCPDGHRYEVLVMQGEVCGLDADHPNCPTCGSTEFERLVGGAIGIDLGGEAGVGKLYPYFDRGLMTYVKSAKHRREICKARGLVPVDGDIDLDADRRKQDAAESEVRRKYHEIKDHEDNDPAFADFRRLRDMGYFKDRAERERRGRS